MDKQILKYLLVLLFGIGIFYVGDVVERSNFTELILGFSFLFVASLLLYLKRRQFTWKQWIWVLIGIKGVLLFSTPNLSEDYLRFLWDGEMIIEGKSPYQYSPESIIDDPNLAPKHADELYPDLNSKIYFSVYPPVNQILFALSSLFGIEGGLFFLKLLILISEIGIFILLRKLLIYFKQDEYKSLIYSLNPLVIIETVGNVHFEGMMFFFMLLSLWLWIQNRKVLSPIVYSLAIGTKLIPLMFLPFLFRKIGLKRTVIFCLIAGGSLLLQFLPFINMELISNFWASIDLYFQSFEFNASIYYIIREVGFQIKGWNIIQVAGPWLSIVAFLGILFMAFQNRFFKDRFFEKMVIAFTIYLFCATTVHPWYLITLLGISVFTNIKYPILWSFLVLLSYSHYMGGGFDENFWWIGLEYGLLVVAVVFERCGLGSRGDGFLSRRFR